MKYKNKFGPQSKNLSSIIRGFKIGVKNFSNENKIYFLWQDSFYDHIVRDEKELNKIRQYIVDNPLKWELDRNNSENLFM
jgi:REP element-mobilizing transposase RayT